MFRLNINANLANLANICNIASVPNIKDERRSSRIISFRPCSLLDSCNGIPLLSVEEALCLWHLLTDSALTCVSPSEALEDEGSLGLAAVKGTAPGQELLS